jgi:hypothetical protein
MNFMQVKSESAIMVCNPLAVLPGLPTDAAELMTGIWFIRGRRGD